MDEKNCLRELAKKYAGYAKLPVMKERADFWFAHNSLKALRPAVVIEMLTFENDVLPPLKCESEFGRRAEKTFLRHILNYECINDDKVIPDCFEISMDIRILPFGREQRREHAKDSAGRDIGYKDVHFIQDIEADLDRLESSIVLHDVQKQQAYADFARESFGDILPVRIKNTSLEWCGAISQHIINLMGMEAFMYALYDYPDEIKRLYAFVCDDIIGVLRRQEELGLLTPNNGNDYAGAGSYGFTAGLKPVEPIKSSMLWGNLNSQETVSISEDMYREFVFPAYEKLAAEFGMVYYGCCEPVHPIWESCISRLPNLKKVSVSPWCDEEFMGKALAGSGVIYSRKPSPNFLGVGAAFDEEAYSAHIEKTLKAARGCTLEIIHRDIYTLSGNTPKIKRAVEIIRNLIDRHWR